MAQVLDARFIEGTTAGLVRKMVECVPSDSADLGGFGPGGLHIPDDHAIGFYSEASGTIRFLDIDGDVVSVSVGQFQSMPVLLSKIFSTGTVTDAKIFFLLV